MSNLDELARAYSTFVALPWSPTLAHAQRVWIVIYPPGDERRLRARLGEFELGTIRSNHSWKLVDVTSSFAQWLGSHSYREAYFERPDLLGSAAIDDFDDYVSSSVRAALKNDQVDDQTVVALLGVGSLFPFTKVSRLLETVGPAVRGRLVVFFPGDRDGFNYRLLEARDGWNYLATPIIVEDVL